MTTTEITDITTNTVISGGNISDEGSSPVIARGVCWSTFQNPTTSDNITTDGTGTSSFTSNISGLSVNTTYYVRAYATNSEGTGYGQILSFTTQPPGVPKLTTVNVTLSDFGPEVGGLTGGTIVSDGGNYVTARGVCWSTNELPTIADKKTIDGKGSGSFQSMALGLSSLTTYYLRAYATNDLGTGYGNQVSFTTPCIMMAGIKNWVVSQFSPANDANGQSLSPTLTWQTTNNPFELRYTIYFGKNVNPDSTIVTNQSTKSITINGLKVNSTYYWKVFAQDRSLPCNNATSSIWSFTTLTLEEITIPSVSTTSITFYTNTFATVGGNVSSDGGLSVTERGIYWGTSTSPETTGTKVQIGSGTGSFSTLLSELSPNTTYYVKAYATNSKGTAFGTQISFTTTYIIGIDAGTVTDIDGNVYKTVLIGTQVWMTQNLKTTMFKDGTAIPLVTDKTVWPNLKTPGYCWYDNDETTFKATYGALYNWYTVITGNLCPAGWHVPSDAEWITLTVYLGGESIAGANLKEAGTTYWNIPNTLANNESGFTALPGGHRILENMVEMYLGSFHDFRYYGYWWSSTEAINAYFAWSRSMEYSSSNINKVEVEKRVGLSVRCVKD